MLGVGDLVEIVEGPFKAKNGEVSKIKDGGSIYDQVAIKGGLPNHFCSAFVGFDLFTAMRRGLEGVVVVCKILDAWYIFLRDRSRRVLSESQRRLSS